MQGRIEGFEWRHHDIQSIDRNRYGQAVQLSAVNAPMQRIIAPSMTVAVLYAISMRLVVGALLLLLPLLTAEAVALNIGAPGLVAQNLTTSIWIDHGPASVLE